MKETVHTGVFGMVAVIGTSLVELADEINVFVRVATGLVGLAIAVLTLWKIVSSMRKKHHEKNE